MTIREVYENVLIEINKENAQSFTIEEFNYTLNKAILIYVNKKYNFYPVNQQLSDDLRVLLKTQKFNVIDVDTTIGTTPMTHTYNLISSYVLSDTTATTIPLSSVKDLNIDDVIIFGADSAEHTISTIGAGTITLGTSATVNAGTAVKLKVNPITTDSELTAGRKVDINFPASDYLHLLSCRTTWRVKKASTGQLDYVTFPTRRLTYEMLNAIENNSYLKPAPNKPYHQIFDNTMNSGVVEFPSTLADYKEYQNKPRFSIHIGSANSYMELVTIDIDYLKLPEVILLKDEDIFSYDVDSSQVLEFPRGVQNEIIKECVDMLLEREANPRLQTHPLLNQETPVVPLSIQGAAAPSRDYRQAADTNN